jgi:hypothetical protein
VKSHFHGIAFRSESGFENFLFFLPGMTRSEWIVVFLAQLASSESIGRRFRRFTQIIKCKDAIGFCDGASAICEYLRNQRPK